MEVRTLSRLASERLHVLTQAKSFEPLGDVVGHQGVPPGRAFGAKFYADLGSVSIGLTLSGFAINVPTRWTLRISA
jgi:hypothetical protein